ncbi:hypothetical protein [Neisseria iguanae]|uniref:hypothetical protein n=1 Tax=Neisseria iguanae TaxID=90242 RepID=UPI001473709C|nr:hypothetical protein [Neisseria iguanae]
MNHALMVFAGTIKLINRPEAFQTAFDVGKYGKFDDFVVGVGADVLWFLYPLS